MEMKEDESKDKKPMVVDLVPSISRAIATMKQAGGKVVPAKEVCGDRGWHARLTTPSPLRPATG
jgi:predicted enzyme related to lactoylglutathione lyase